MTEQITPEYLSFVTEHHASDIFIIAGRPLSFKINGKLSIYGERLMPADTEILLRQIYQMSNNRNFDRFLEIGDDDFSFSIPGLSRFRVNTYRQRGSLAAVIRVIAFELPDPEFSIFRKMLCLFLILPKEWYLLQDLQGSGKSTTMACIVNRINHSREGHIITLKTLWNICTDMTNVLSASGNMHRYGKLSGVLRATLRQSRM